MIEMQCPHCGHQLRIRSKYAGRQGQCKHCQGFVDVPNTYVEEAALEMRKATAELPTTPINRPAAPINRPAAPVKGTALADLLGGDDASVADAPANKPPHEPTALEDLTFDDFVPADAKATVPMSPDAIDAITGDDSITRPPFKRLGWIFWVLTLVFAPIALIMAVRLPKGHPQKRAAIVAPLVLMGAGGVAFLAVFVGLPFAVLSTWNRGGGATAPVGRLTIDPPVVNMAASPTEYVSVQALGPGGYAQEVVWTSSDPAIAEIVEDSGKAARVYGVAPGTATIRAEIFATGESALATVMVSPSSTASASAGVSYAATRLPSYPGLVFQEADHSENYLEGSLAGADPATLTTFVGRSSKDYETITAFFFQEIQNRGWIVEANGYGDADNSETYIVATSGGYGFVYRTSADGARTKVVITYGPIPEGV